MTRSPRIAFNALSVSNLSGRHVLLGHLEQVLSTVFADEVPVLLHRSGDRLGCSPSDGMLRFAGVSDLASNWVLRRAVERIQIPGVLRAFGVSILFQPDGALAPVPGVRQWVLAQNPWCFFSELHRTPAERAKAWLQTKAYARAQASADIMFYNSEYMAKAYERAAGFPPRSARILHQGVAADAFERGPRARPFSERRPEIVVVSAMAPHKNIEAVVACLARLRGGGVDARLRLVGGWPDPAYRTLIEREVRARGLAAHVDFVGHVSRERLLDHYGEARVFCLLSRCESFGIPAVEAQACGTPTVVARGTAAPEIAGPGGRIVGADDEDEATGALAELLTDERAWQAAREAAGANAERFRWARCSTPLLEALGALREGAG